MFPPLPPLHADLKQSVMVCITYAYFFRGREMLQYEEADLADFGGYDLVHHDDLSYVASAHQERKEHRKESATFSHLRCF